MFDRIDRYISRAIEIDTIFKNIKRFMRLCISSTTKVNRQFRTR